MIDKTLLEDNAMEDKLQKGIIKGEVDVKYKKPKDTFSCLIQKQMEILKKLEALLASKADMDGVNINIYKQPEPPKVVSVFSGKIKEEKK